MVDGVRVVNNDARCRIYAFSGREHECRTRTDGVEWWDERGVRQCGFCGFRGDQRGWSEVHGQGASIALRRLDKSTGEQMCMKRPCIAAGCSGAIPSGRTCKPGSRGPMGHWGHDNQTGEITDPSVCHRRCSAQGSRTPGLHGRVGWSRRSNAGRPDYEETGLHVDVFGKSQSIVFSRAHGSITAQQPHELKTDVSPG